MGITSAQLPFIDGSRLIRSEARVADAFFLEGRETQTTPMGISVLPNPGPEVSFLFAGLNYQHAPYIGCAMKLPANETWTGFHPLAGAPANPHLDPCLSMWENRLFLLFSLPSNHLGVYWYDFPWYGLRFLKELDFKFAPISAAFLGRYLWIAQQKSDNTVWLTRLDPGLVPVEYPTNITAIPKSDPIVYCFNDQLYLATCQQ